MSDEELTEFFEKEKQRNNRKHGIKHAITELCKDRCCNPGLFEEFTARLSDLGVVRQTYDVIKNELLFYSKNQLLLIHFIHIFRFFTPIFYNFYL